MRHATVGSVLVSVLLLSTIAGAAVAVPVGAVASGTLEPRTAAPAVTPGPGSFALVSNFEDGALDGWTVTSGSAKVSTSVTYGGEPSLLSPARPGTPQVDRAQGIVAGGSFVSMQVAIHGGSGGTGFFGLADSGGVPVAVVGVQNGEVYAGATPSTASAVEPVPTGTAQPAGWVYLAVNVYAVAGKGGSPPAWQMDVFVDRSDQVAAAGVSVPAAGTYAEARIATTAGTVAYSDIVVSNYEIPIYLPGYNNMEGYGQGSGLLVQLLPAFTTLSAQMTLSSWDVPQSGILSFQVNAMNYYGTTRSTCKGFFQLGIDLDPNGTIAPWYVPGVNCVAHYFLPSNNPAVGAGFASPSPTHLTLTIQDQPAMKEIRFQIVDHSVGPSLRYWNATIPYEGTEFFGSYTQIEWQPCCSNYPISDYSLNARMYGLTISGGNLSAPELLGANYMLPFVLDTPPSWSFTYYDGSSAGYAQRA